MTRTILLLISLAHCAICNGQTFFKKMFVEPRVNLSTSVLINSESPFGYGDYDQQAVNSASYSILFRYQLSEKYSLLAGYCKEQKGTTGTYQYFKADGTVTEDKLTETAVRNSYNTFPVFLRRYSKERSISFFGDFGFYISSMSRSDIKGYVLESVVFEGDTIRGENYFYKETDEIYTNSIDFGILAGGGFDYKLTPRLAVQFNPQVSIGLVKLDNYHSNDTVTLSGTSGTLVLEMDYFNLNSRSKNFLFSMNFGLSYKLAK